MAMFERSLLLKGPILDFHDYGSKGRYEYTHIWNHEIMFDAYRQDFNSPLHNLYILGPALNLFAFPLLLKVAERRCSQLLKHEIRSGKATKKVGSYRWSEWIDFPCRWGWILDCVMVSKRPGGGGDSEAASKSLETCRVKRPRFGQWHQIAVGAFNDYFYRDPYDPWGMILWHVHFVITGWWKKNSTYLAIEVYHKL